MTPLLTDNLPLLAYGPNGIKKLRDLILELAVRGKLVPQDPSDEPASDLLKRIAEKKMQWVVEGKIKKGKAVDDAIPGISYRIPSTWAVASLGQVVEIVRGITFPASEKSKEPESGRVACLRTANIQNEVEWDDLLYIRESFISRTDQYVQPYDIVMSMANSRELVGKVALIGAQLNQPTTFGGFLGVLRPVLIEPRFIMALLRTPGARSALIDSASQTTNIANVSLAKLRPLPFAIPPLSEQHRIVAKVDELMALCDCLEARQADAESAHAQLVQALLDSLNQARDAIDFATNWQRLAKNFHPLFTTKASIDALKQTLLQLAVTGKLVPQDPGDESVTVLVKRIQAEKQRYLAESNARRQKNMVINSLSEPPFEVPACWQWQTIDDVLHVTGGVTLGRKLGDRKLLSKPYLRVANVQRGRLEMEQIKEVEVPEDEVGRYRLRNGDLLITEGGDWDKVGRTAIWRNELPECLHQNHVFRARAVVSDWEPRWAEMYLNSASARKYFAGSSKQTTNLASINMTQLRACAFPLPPLGEQRRIIAKLDQLMALCDQIQTRLTQARQLNEQLASTLARRALIEESHQAPVATDREVARTLLAAEITHRLHSQRTFGQRKLQKVIYLVEHTARLAAVQGNYLRDAAGPHDRQMMSKVEGEMQKNQWYERIERETVGHAYRPLPQAGQHRQGYEDVWSDEERSIINRVIELMRSWDTDRCEMTVTLYAVWNDFILEGRPVTDEAIVDEVMHRWNDAKLRFSKTEWLAVLANMKKHEILRPAGFGKRTTGGMLSLPGFE
ncbi:restriction endonuclease subunit S [Pseudomonas viciae]|uniref:Restriction endonuclease subunit S n=1 Tax=Pseudomonas viciae TaxID=2505979 RepID=A0ABY8PC70_9PSED|nr:restriction endonuclease subunit S [Pseudomonas viciae]WGO92796.1 restriction endonuclease subunit S [Pseudomonas viciae]